MLQENEVRIGNAVKDSTGRIGTIMSIGKNQVRVRFEFSTVKIDTNHDEVGLDIEAVLLTPEILEKCGFKYGMVEGIATIQDTYNSVDEDGDTEYWDKGKLTIVRWGKKQFILSHKSSFDHRIEIKSLHQLQNIYYSLVGSELEVVW
jgi:hypothetical protein